MKPTPGPWETKIYSDSNVRDALGIFANDNDIPIVRAAYGDNLEQADANARLIAAAPELLEALREFGEVTAPFLVDAISSKNSLVCAAINKANLAIAKAIGE